MGIDLVSKGRYDNPANEVEVTSDPVTPSPAELSQSTKQ